MTDTPSQPPAAQGGPRRLTIRKAHNQRQRYQTALYPLPPRPSGSSRKWKYSLHAFLIAITMFVVTALSYWLLQPSRTKVTGALTHATLVRTTFDTEIENGTSPACGCFLKRDDTRGIGFFSDAIQLNISSDDVAYALMADTPRPTDIEPRLSFEAKVYQINLGNSSVQRDAQSTTQFHKPENAELDKYSGLNVSNLVHDSSGEMNVVSRTDFLEAYVVNIYGGRTLHIHQFGEFPLAAWLPTANSDITISINRLREEIEMKETVTDDSPDYNTRDDSGNPVQSRRIIHPVLDLAGVPIVLWSDEISKVTVNDVSVERPHGNDNIVTAIVLRAAFSLRMISFSSTENNFGPGVDTNKLFGRLDGVSLDDVTHGRHKDRILDVTYLVRKRKHSDYSLLVRADEALKRKIKKARKLSGNFVTGFFKALGKPLGLQYAYPTFQTFMGFAIWGYIPWITIEGTQGALSADSTTVNIGAPSTLTLTAMSNTDPTYQVVEFSVDGHATFDSNAEDLRVNGDSVYRNLDKYKNEIAVLGILSLVVPIIGWVWAHKEIAWLKKFRIRVLRR